MDTNDDDCINTKPEGGFFVEQNFLGFKTQTKLFLKDVETRFPNVHADIFLWSLLHEIGHSETLDDLDDEVEEHCIEIKQKLNEHPDWSIEICNAIYFNCPDERAATDWAGEYLETHYAEISLFWIKLQKAIKEFYKLNAIN